MFRLYGLPVTSDGTVTYKTWLSCVPPDDRDKQERSLLETIQLAGSSAREFRIWSANEQEWRLTKSAETICLNEGQVEARWRHERALSRLQPMIGCRDGHREKIFIAELCVRGKPKVL